MAYLPEETTKTALELQRQLLIIINEARSTEFSIFEQYGETEKSIISLDQLQNIRERGETYYTRLYQMLLKIAESQPVAVPTMLELLDSSMEESEATINASQASILEIKRDWNKL